jgi:hypothetical protein
MATQTRRTTAHTRTTPTRPELPAQAPTLRGKTHIKAGNFPPSGNHNQTVWCADTGDILCVWNRC